jgi:deferrochelatase/peroxidase EfeB
MNRTTRTDNPLDIEATPGRRDLLWGAARTAALALGTAATAGTADAAQLMQQPPGRDAVAATRVQPFFGPYQPGILNPPPAVGLVAAFDVLASDRAGLRRLFELLTQRIVFLMSGGTPPDSDPRFPPNDSGVLGPVIVPDNLTVTTALGATLFDERYGLAKQRPVHLETMRRFTNDALDNDWCHGDLLLQFCANTQEATIHALRDVLKNTPGLLRLRWKLDGFLPAATLAAGSRETPRNLLGFKDGTANLDPGDDALMNRHVWVAPKMGEPAWAEGGSYQVVRIIRNFVERWDRTPLQEQEAIVGRKKVSGAPLSMSEERDIPDYASDPGGRQMRLDAHIRLANPRTRETSSSLLLRRPFNYSRGVTRSGQLDMGLLFICFQANLAEGFVAVQTRLNGEPLEEYIKPVGGGYFFALPGVPRPGGYLGQALVEAT